MRELCILNECDEQTLPFEAGLRSPRVRWRPCGPAGPRTLRGGAWRCEGPAGLVGPHAAVLGTRRPSRSPGLRRDGLISTRGQCVKVLGVLGRVSRLVLRVSLSLNVVFLLQERVSEIVMATHEAGGLCGRALADGHSRRGRPASTCGPGPAEAGPRGPAEASTEVGRTGRRGEAAPAALRARSLARVVQVNAPRGDGGV